MNDEFKDCPFCGGPATRNDEEGDPDELYLSCINLNCCGAEWWFKPDQWQSRPLESALQSKLSIAVEALEYAAGTFSIVDDKYSYDRIHEALAKIRS